MNVSYFFLFRATIYNSYLCFTIGIHKFWSKNRSYCFISFISFSEKLCKLFSFFSASTCFVLFEVTLLLFSFIIILFKPSMYFLLAKFGYFNLLLEFCFAELLNLGVVMIRNFIWNFLNFCVVVSFLTNLQLSIAFTFVTNWLYTVFLATSLSTTLLSLLQSSRTVLSLPISI